MTSTETRSWIEPVTPDARTQPLVSVLMPSYNHARYVEASIRSVMDQHYPRVELIVVDDESRDETPEIVSRLATQYQFVFLRNTANMGVNESLLRALSHSNGDYVAMLASDDQIEPDKIAKQVEYIRKNDLDGVYSSGVKLFDDGSIEPIDHDVVAKKFSDGSILDHIYITDTDGPLMQSGLFSRRMWEDLAPYRKKFKSDDHMFLIKGLEKYRIGFLAERLFRYRIHDNNSYKRYWHTLPHRVDIASNLTPEHLKIKYMSNIFFSHAEFLFLDGRKGNALKFAIASMILWPSPSRSLRLFRKAVRGVIKQFGRRHAR